jgi:hypothetical protein
MKPHSSLYSEIAGVAILVALVPVSGGLLPGVNTRPAPIQLAQEVFGEPIGEEDGPIGGPTVYGQDVGSPPVGGPMVYGEDVGSAPIGGPMVGGEPVGSAPIDGPMIDGAPVGTGGDDEPIGGDTLY